MLAIQNAKKAVSKADVMIYKQASDTLNASTKKSISKRTGRAGSTVANDPYTLD
jgi:hypothetical protein